MKKILSILLTALVLLTIAVSCAQDVTVDAQLYNKVDTEVFMLNGKYYATLQEAVNARLGKGAKAAGDNDDVIYLRKNAAGPGAVINDPNTPVVIDFAGCTYSFKDVTATQGSTTGTFGLSISGGSEVTLKGTSTMTLFDSTANLTMVYVSGSNSSLVIEDAPKMEVKENQYVFWATDGATLTIGGETTMTGGLAATGTEEKVPRVIISTTEESSISTLKIAAATVEPTGGNVKVASLKASDNAIISASGEAGITITSDDSGDSSYSIQNNGEGTVKNEDATINHGEAQKTTDGTKTTEAASVARIGTQNYSTIASAIEAGDGKTIVLLADITESPIETGSRTITADLNGKNVGATGAEIVFNTTDGLLIVQNTSQAIGSVFIKTSESTITDNGLVIYGGKYNCDVSPYVAEGYVARKTGTSEWTVFEAKEVEVTIGTEKKIMSLVGFANKVNNGVEGYSTATVKLLKDADLEDIAWSPIGTTTNPFKGSFDGQNHTISGLTFNGGGQSYYGFFGVIGGASTTTTIANLVLEDIDYTTTSGVKNIGGLFAGNVSAVAGAATASNEIITISNVSVSGTISAFNVGGATIGGVGGKVYTKGQLTVTNCTSSVDITCNESITGDIKAAGIVGFVSDSNNTNDAVILIDGCKNYGNMDLKTSSGVYSSGIINKSWCTVYVKDCSTQGEFVLESTNREEGAQNSYRVFFSVIGRLQNYNTNKESTTEYQGVTYDVYGDSSSSNIMAHGNTISSVSGYKSFKATITDYNENWDDIFTREIDSSYEGLDLFRLYNNMYNTPDSEPASEPV